MAVQQGDRLSVEVIEYRNMRSVADYPEEIAQGLRTCISDAFGRNEEGVCAITPEDAENHMAGDQVQVAVAAHEWGEVREGQVVGFSSVSLMVPSARFGDQVSVLPQPDDLGLYLDGIAVAEVAQSNGISHMLSAGWLRRFGLEENGVNHVFTRTQNPRVIEGTDRDIERAQRDGLISDIQRGRLICRGAYPSMLTADMPTGRELDLTQILDHSKGDAIVQQWTFNRVAAK